MGNPNLYMIELRLPQHPRMQMSHISTHRSSISTRLYLYNPENTPGIVLSHLCAESWTSLIGHYSAQNIFLTHVFLEFWHETYINYLSAFLLKHNYHQGIPLWASLIMEQVILAYSPFVQLQLSCIIDSQVGTTGEETKERKGHRCWTISVPSSFLAGQKSTRWCHLFL